MTVTKQNHPKLPHVRAAFVSVPCLEGGCGKEVVGRKIQSLRLELPEAFIPHLISGPTTSVASALELKDVSLGTITNARTREAR